MSTDTTNTNNGTGNGANRPKHAEPRVPTPPSGESARYYPFGTIPLPDPATLERLANEFFRAMPPDLANGDGNPPSVPTPDGTEEIPVTMFEEPLPTGETSPLESPTGLTASFYPQPGPLNEADLRAIAASLLGSAAVVPGAPATTPKPQARTPVHEFLTQAEISPFAIAPTLPPGNEMLSFPGVSAVSSSPPTAPPSGADVGAPLASPDSPPITTDSTPYFSAGEQGKSPADASVLPPVDDLFAFPRIPATPNARGIETLPNSPTPPASPISSVTAPTEASAAPVGQHDVKGVTPQVPRGPASKNRAAPATPAPDHNVIYPGAVTSLPSLSDLFSFPGLPGVQSPLGVPAMPSSSTVSPKLDPDIRNVDLNRQVPAVDNLFDVRIAEPYGEIQKQESPTSRSGVEAFDFHPNLVPADLGNTKRPLDARLIRRDFPILEERVHGRPLIWLDNAATTQKPNAVIERLAHFYRHENSNIHRAAHELAARSTDAYESAREKTRRFLNASSNHEIIFVRGATEGINLVAQSWGRRNVREGDEVVITWLEHHANIVPWQMLCSEKGAKLRVAPVNDRGEIILEEYEKLLGPRTRIVSFSQVSNALGTVTPAREMVEIAHRYGARVLVDGAQSVSHMPVDVQTLDCDLFVFSGHKVFAPTGIGVVFGKLDLLETTPPWQGGGSMIADVTFEKTTYQGSPARFEAGTGNIADAVGLGAALDYVDEIGRENIAAYEHDLLNYATAKLLTVVGLRLIGTAREKAGVLSFVLDDIRTEDVGAALNREGIAVRAGHHCAQPILRRMGVESTVRPSLAFYNTCEDIDTLVAALLRLQAGRGKRML